MTEVWKPIVGYEGLYEVSDMGRVKRLPRMVYRKYRGRTVNQQLEEKLLTPVLSNPNNQGRYRVTLTKDGKVSLRLLHTVVLETFVGERPGTWKEVNGCHNDGDFSNNCLPNLRWDTKLNNEADKVKHGTAAKGELNGQAKLSSAQVDRIVTKLSEGSKQRDLAAEFGVSRSAILHINIGNTWRSQAA